MYAMDSIQIGTNIQNKLNEKKMTANSLADALGISNKAMDKIINGSKAVNKNELAKISDVLNVSIDTLLTVSTEPNTVSNVDLLNDVRNNNNILKDLDLFKTAIDEIHILEELLDD